MQTRFGSLPGRGIGRTVHAPRGERGRAWRLAAGGGTLPVQFQNAAIALLQATEAALLRELHALGLAGDVQGQPAWPFARRTIDRGPRRLAARLRGAGQPRLVAERPPLPLGQRAARRGEHGP